MINLILKLVRGECVRDYFYVDGSERCCIRFTSGLISFLNSKVVGIAKINHAIVASAKLDP